MVGVYDNELADDPQSSDIKRSTNCSLEWSMVGADDNELADVPQSSDIKRSTKG
jgi:hypothetical protein